MKYKFILFFHGYLKAQPLQDPELLHSLNGLLSLVQAFGFYLGVSENRGALFGVLIRRILLFRVLY